MIEKSIKIELYEKLIACLALPSLCYLLLFPIYIMALVGRTPLETMPMGVHVVFFVAHVLLVINLIMYGIMKRKTNERIDFYKDHLMMFIRGKKINLSYHDIRAVIYYKYPLWTIPLVILANGAHAAGAMTFQTQKNKKYRCHVFMHDYKKMLCYLKRNESVRIIED